MFIYQYNGINIFCTRPISTSFKQSIICDAIAPPERQEREQHNYTIFLYARALMEFLWRSKKELACMLYWLMHSQMLLSGMSEEIKLLFPLIALCAISLLPSCGDGSDGDGSKPPPYQYSQFNQEERDYIERFNTTVKDIRDFPPPGKDAEKYFHVFKTVPRIEDAEIILFGETHNHALNHIWSAGVINRLIKPQDVVLFEGAQAGTKVDNLAEHFATQIFAAREYEKLKAHKAYKPTGISKIEGKFQQLFSKTKNALQLDVLKLGQGSGYFWDLVDGNRLHRSLAKRNETMVQTIKDKLGGGRVFVIAGALHLPHHEFAYLINLYKKYPLLFANFTAHAGADETKINGVFYDYFDGTGAKHQASTRSIFDFLKGKRFAVLIPKNLPAYITLKPFYPTNAE